MSLKTNYSFHTNFVFRNPSSSLSEIARSQEFLQQAAKDIYFQEAIYISTPVLYNEIQSWLAGELTEKKKVEKLTFSLFKYFSRMSSRCTPYGLFASCSTGNWSNQNEIVYSGNRPAKRLDMNFLGGLTFHLVQLPSVREVVLFFPNNSIYTIGNRLRYVEYKFSGNKRSYETSSVDASEYLSSILSAARSGKTFSELTKLLVSKEVSLQEAISFVNALIENQLLVTELELTITGEDAELHLLNVLKKINNNKQIPQIENAIGQLENTSKALKDKNCAVAGVEVYQTIFKQLSLLKIPLEENHLFQVDSFGKTAKANLNKNIQTKILEVAEFLGKINLPNSNGDLQNFKNKFLELFENMEMPLLEILDTETGIGYPNKDNSGVNKLVEDVQVAQQNQNGRTNSGNLDAVLLKKLIDGFKSEKYSIALTRKDFEYISNPQVQLPPSFVSMFKIIDATKDKIHLSMIGGGSSAANLLGRFAYGDEKIHEVVKDISAFEEKIFQDKIVAEIVHLPESRIGNILFRPVLREYEIPYLGKSGASVEKQIRLEDLFVSVRNNRIVLRSKKLNKEIIPRLSSAHNYSFNSLPVYKFLCDLQMQDIEKPALSFSWGALSNSFSFLPRAEYNNVVLFPATWNLSAPDYSAVAKNISNEDFFAEVKIWKEKWKMPKWIVLKDGDNELLVDFENELSIKTFFNEIKKRPSIQLSEFLFDPENALVRDEKGNPYCNEIIAIVFNHDYKPSPTIDFSKYEAPKTSIQRSFIPGSEWLYYKIYCGVKTADDLLCSVIKQIVGELYQKQLIEKWFFIRYSDPDTHIRLRFYNSDPNKLNEVTKIVAQHLKEFHEQGIISKIQTGTYTRELERYGFNTMEISEDYFSIDSWATLNFLEIAKGDAGEELKWQFAIKSVDDLLDSFNFSQERKLNFLEILKTNFINEHTTDKSLKVQLDNKFRKMRSQVNELFESEKQNLPFTQILEWKKQMIKPIAEKILGIEKNSELEMSLNDLLSSYLHMMLNRIFKAKQRTHEMVIYDLLYRYFKSKMAREKIV